MGKKKPKMDLTMTPEMEELADEVKSQLDALKNEKIMLKVERAAAKGKDSLSLHDKRLNVVPEGIANIPNCKLLDVSKNNLEELPEQVFSELKNTLEVINISHNHFLKLPEELGLMPSIRELHLQNNKLCQLPKDMSSLKLLHILNINSNCITEIPNSMCELKLLKELHCKDNGLTLMPEAEWLLLEKLNTMKNILVALPSSLGTWIALKHLNCASNKIGEIPEGIGNCNKLEEVTLTDNELGVLPESFALLTNLRILHLGRNHFKNDTLQLLLGMTKLEELMLFHNKFSQIPPDFQEFTGMKRFSIANNNVTKIPGRLGVWVNIEEAHFSHNDILEVPMSIGSWWKLKEFYIGWNPRLATLPKSMAENRGLLVCDLREVNPEFLMPKELAGHPRCQFKGIKLKKGKKKKK